MTIRSIAKTGRTTFIFGALALAGCGQSQQYYDAMLAADAPVSKSQTKGTGSSTTLNDGVPTTTASPSPNPSPSPLSDLPPAAGDLVECDLGTPSVKVILSETFTSAHDNASATRVCMSSLACLTLVNRYAADRGCALAPGAATTAGASVTCTGIFPGSKGTCHNSRVLSDAEVGNLLSTMAAKKP